MVHLVNNLIIWTPFSQVRSTSSASSLLFFSTIDIGLRPRFSDTPNNLPRVRHWGLRGEVLHHARNAFSFSPNRYTAELRCLEWTLKSMKDLRYQEVMIGTDFQEIVEAVNKKLLIGHAIVCCRNGLVCYVRLSVKPLSSQSNLPQIIFLEGFPRVCCEMIVFNLNSL